MGIKESIVPAEIKHLYYAWWSQEKRKEIFELVKQGKSLEEISKDQDMDMTRLQETISHPYFLKRFEHYLTRLYYLYQTNKVIYADKALTKLFRIATEQEVGKVSPGMAYKLMIGLLALKEKDPKIINPKQYNFFLNLTKDLKPKELPAKMKELEKEFGYEGLEDFEDENENTRTNTGMDQGKPDPDKQGPASGV